MHHFFQDTLKIQKEILLEGMHKMKSIQVDYGTKT